MLSQSKIFLIGMPGSGKSSVVRILASKLDMPLIDLDDEIEHDQSRTISEIFSDEGEDYFRNLEHEMLNKLILTNASFVMATGGGTPCYNQGIKMMNTAGLSFFLEASLDNLLRRVGSNSDRPLLGNNYAKTLEELLIKRTECYKQANFKLQTDDLSIEEIANSIEQIITR